VAEDVVELIRGFFTTPLLSGLARAGALDLMLATSSFRVDDFAEVPNKRLLGDGLRYLLRLGLLEQKTGGSYTTSELGRQVFRRRSSFLPPHAYRDYMDCFLDELQRGGAYRKREVDHEEVLAGSSRTHERYFPAAIPFLKGSARPWGTTPLPNPPPQGGRGPEGGAPPPGGRWPLCEVVVDVR